MKKRTSNVCRWRVRTLTLYKKRPKNVKKQNHFEHHRGEGDAAPAEGGQVPSPAPHAECAGMGAHRGWGQPQLLPPGRVVTDPHGSRVKHLPSRHTAVGGGDPWAGGSELTPHGAGSCRDAGCEPVLSLPRPVALHSHKGSEGRGPELPRPRCSSNHILGSC